MCVCVCVYKYSIFTSVSASLAGGGAVSSWCHHWLCSWTLEPVQGGVQPPKWEERRYDGVLGPYSTYGCGSFYFWGNLMLKLEKAVAPHSSTLAWKIPWMEEPGRLQPMGLLGVGHDWVTSLSLFTFMHWRRKWQPTAVFLPGESQGRGSLVGCRLWGCTESDAAEAT